MSDHNRKRERLSWAVGGLLAIFGCLWLTWAAGRMAESRLLTKYGAEPTSTAALDSAIQLTPLDAESHYVRAAINHNYLNQPEKAIEDLELAVSLRPRDFYLWLELGLIRDEHEDSAGALQALNESVRLAPYYAQPRWQRGNVLFRAGRYDEAFSDLTAAVRSNPSLLPNLIDLAWGASAKNVDLVEKIVAPRDNDEHLALALFFAAHGKAAAALNHYRLITALAEEKRRELVERLFSSGAYAEAFAVWANGKASVAGSTLTRGLIYDGGFESPLTIDESTFGWRPVNNLTGVRLSADSNQPQSGARSLRVDFSGNSNPDVALLAQFVPVDPRTHYRLLFWTRTKDLVTGARPLIVITEAGPGGRQLARSEPLPASTEQWQSFSVDFATGEKTLAIVISLRREACATICPIFGALNLDSVSLERVE